MMLAKVKHTLSVETETRPDGPPPVDLSPLSGTDSHVEQTKDVRHSHVCCYTLMTGAIKPIVETLPLPEVQPKCPPGWSAEAWDERAVYGTTKYHFYRSEMKPFDYLVVKVADRRGNGKWVYESIDPTDVEREVTVAMAEWTVWKLLETRVKEKEDSELLDGGN